MKIGKEIKFLSTSLPNCKDLIIEIDGKKYLVVYNTKLGFINEIKIFSKSLGVKELPCRLIHATNFKEMYKYIFKRCFYGIRTSLFKERYMIFLILIAVIFVAANLA